MHGLLHKFAQVDISPLPNAGGVGQDRVDVILGVVFGVAGSVALLFLVIGGIRYILSRGDPSGTAQAKNTIIYSLVGLVVVMLAFAIVSFTIRSI